MKRLLAAIGAAFIVSGAAVAADGVIAKRGYVDSRFGQIHYYTFAPTAGGAGSKTPIAFFHQNPKSAVDYEPLTMELGKDRLVLAFDTPGYGMSDQPKEPPSMENLAGAMADALTNLGYGKSARGGRKPAQIDVFGFHTGSFIAAELAVQRPDLVRRVVLSGIPWWTPEVRKQRLDATPRNAAIPEDASLVVQRWYSAVNARSPGISIERAARTFTEDIRSLNKFWYGSYAVLTWKAEDRLPKITQPVLIVQPPEMLQAETLAAHREALPKATLAEIPGVTKDVFDLAGPEYAARMRPWLDQ